jgi:hypothetical protein
LPEASPAKPVVKYSVPFTGFRSRKDVLPGPALGSATRVVPAAVPSLFQSSRPLTPSSAAKYNVPFMFVSWLGRALPTPG